MTDKYEMLKRYVNGVADFTKDDSTLEDIKELMETMDRVSDNEDINKSHGENLIDKETFNSMTYKQRVDLKDEQPETYANAITGKFKEEK